MKTIPHPRAFSLVEVTLALAVISFCLLTLLALLPIGLSSTRDSVQKTTAAGIASQIAADLRSTPLATSATPPVSPRFGLPLDAVAATPLGTTNSFYLDDSGNPMTSDNSYSAGAIYKATVLVWTPKVAGTAASAYSQNKPTMVRIIVSWPAAADQTKNAYPTHYQGYFDIVTAVDRN